MQRLWNARSLLFNQDWQSKLTDGVLTMAALVLVWLTINLVVRPIELLFGQPGLLIYVLVLMAFAMYFLQQAMLSRRLETIRVWFGIAGGLFAWAVVDLSGYMGGLKLPYLTAVVILIMVSLILALLWRNVLPQGVRFFGLTFLLSWIGNLIIRFQADLVNLSPVFYLTYRITAYLAILGAVLLLGWTIFRARRRVHRVSGALAVWFFISLALSVFWGKLY